MENKSIEQRIIGTWIDEESGKWVFNANGTGIDGGVKINGDARLKFGVTDTQLAFVSKKRVGTCIYNISMSSDGRTMILSGSTDNGLHGYWLTKQ